MTWDWLDRAIGRAAATGAALLVSLAAAQEDPTAAEIDQLFAAWDRSDSPGCSLAVVRDGALVYSRGYGQASLEHTAPISATTPIHVASVSKQFTAFAVILLAEEGQLALDDDVRRHLPELPDFGARITLRHLIHHTSGLRDQWDLLVMAGWRMDDVITEEDVLHLVRHQRALNFPPGTRYVYCNTGYTLLARIVAEVSGKPFHEFCRVRIFEPLGMRATHFHHDHQHVVPGRAYSYSPDGAGGYRKAVLSYAVTGATSLFTTAEDLARWQANFERPLVGSRALSGQLLERGVLVHGETLDYACGLVHGHYRGLRTIGHDGSDAGFRASVLRFPEQKFSVIVLSNLASFQAGTLAGAVAQRYLSEAMARAESESAGADAARGERVLPPLQPLAPGDIEPFAGLYLAPLTQGLWRVRARDGILKFAARATVPIGARRFRTRRGAGPLEVEFAEPVAGTSQRARITLASGATGELRRVQPAGRADARELAIYCGRYYSPEIEALYELRIVEGQLELEWRKHRLHPLRPRFRDGFACSRFRVHFTRDLTDRIDGFSMSSARVFNLRFDRVSSNR